MSLFKRLSTTFVSRIDQVVGEIENHDAVIQVTLNDMRKKVAEAKVRLNQVHREQGRLNSQIIEHQKNAQRWRQRAVNCAGHDEAKALECLSRGRHCQQMIEKLEVAQEKYELTADKLARDIETTEQRLAEVKQKLTLMRARQSTSSALKATSDAGNDATQLLDDTFDRWEINISQDEIVSDTNDYFDPMEREFIVREQEDELRNELATLLAEEKKP